MQIEDDTWVTVRYRLYDAQGEALEPDERELTYLQGGYGAVFPLVEEALAGQAIGFQTTVFLEPEDGFGEYDADLLRIAPRSAFPAALELGMTFEGVPGEEEDEDGLFTVTDITDEAVVLDGNHPLAGLSLRFDLQVIDVREATDEEVAAERAAVDTDEGGDDADQAQDDRPEAASRPGRWLH